MAFGHAPPADGLHLEALIGGRRAHPGSPTAGGGGRGTSWFHQGADAKRESTAAAMAQRHRPEAAGRKRGCTTALPPNTAWRGSNTPAHWCGTAARDMCKPRGCRSWCAALIRAPHSQGVGMCPDHALGPRCGARGVLHREPRPRIVGARRQQGRVGIDPIEALFRGGGPGLYCSPSNVGDRQPADQGSSAQPGRQRRLRDAGDRAAVLGEISQFVGTGSRIGGDRDCAGYRAAQPRDDRLRTVVQMHQHEVAGTDAALVQPRGKTVQALGEGPIRPGLGAPSKALNG